MGLREDIEESGEDFESFCESNLPALFQYVLENEKSGLNASLVNASPTYNTESTPEYALKKYVKDMSPMISSAVKIQNVNVEGVCQWKAPVRTDSGWSYANDEFTYSGNADRVYINAMVTFEISSRVSGSNVAPIFNLEKDGEIVATAQTGLIVDRKGMEESSISIAWTDCCPDEVNTYRVTTERGSTVTKEVTSTLGHFVAEALVI